MRSWAVIIYAVIMQALTMGCCIFPFSIFVVFWMREFKVESSFLIAASAVSSIVCPVIAPLCGRCVDKFNIKWLIVFGATASSCGLLMMSRATNPSLIVFVAGVIFPFGLMLSGPLIGYAMVVRTKVAKMGLALGISSLGMSLGGGIPVIITYLLDKHNWREVTVMLALVLFTVIVVPAIFLIPRSICRNEGKQNERKRTPLNSKSQYLPLIFLGVAYLAPSLVSLSILQNLGAFAAEISLAPSDAAIIIAVGSLIAAGGQFVIGWALERVDRVLLYWAILIAMFVGLFILSRADHFQGLISGYCVVAILAAVMSPLMASFVRHYWGVVQFGSAMGALQAFGFCAGFGPLLVACLRDFFGGYHAAFLSLEIALFPAAFAFIAFLSSSRMLRISTESNTYFNDAVDRMAQGVADQP